MDFGACAEVFQDNAILSNANWPKFLPATLIGQKTCRKPSHYVISLVSDKRIRRAQHKELPIPNEAIAIVHRIERKQKQLWIPHDIPIVSHK